MDIITDKSSGLQFCVNEENLYEEGIPDIDLINWCKQFIDKSGGFIDIGAKYGKYSIILGKECKNVYSFESRKEVYECLIIGASINNLFNITIENVELGSDNNVAVRTLDSYDFKNIRFIKIKTNGSELDVLKGSLLTLINNEFPPIIFNDTSDDEKVVTLSRKIGYKVVKISGMENMYLASDHPLSVKNSKIEEDVIEEAPKYNIEELCEKYEAGNFDISKKLDWDEWHLLARHYRIISKHQLSYNCCILGLEVSPNDKEYLFYEEISIVAFYINKKDEGFKAAEKVILSQYTPWSTKNLALSNEGFYMSPIPIKRKIPIKYRLPLYYTPSSSSIIKNNQGFRINLRGINYYLSEGGYGISRHGDNIIRTINYLLDTDNDLNITNGIELIDKSNVKLFPKNILGMEDIRLFGDNYLFCTYLELNESRIPQIGWGTYEPETGYVTRMVPLSVSPEIKCEKNWLPFINDDGEIYFIYAMGPLQLYHLDKETGNVKQIKYSELGVDIIDTSIDISNKECYINDFRGSASPIPYKSGWLCTIHQVHHAEPRKYFHRFVWFNKEFTEIKFTLPFYFDKIGVEFNLSICEHDDGMLLLYSHADASSTIAIIDYKVINDMLGL